MSLIAAATGVSQGSITNNWVPADLPAHQAGDLLVMMIGVRTALANRGTVPPNHIRQPSSTYGAGWQYTGGWADGANISPGTDNGPMAAFVYTKVATSSAEPVPQLTSGNLLLYRFFVLRPPSGYKWRDVVDGVLSTGSVVFAGDQDTASPLAGVASEWGTPPRAGDIVIEMGHLPTDSSVNPAGASTLTVPGLTGGTKTPLYHESGSGQDAGCEWIVWEDFTGEASGPPSASHPFNANAGSMNAGVLAFFTARIEQDAVEEPSDTGLFYGVDEAPVALTIWRSGAEVPVVSLTRWAGGEETPL